MGATRRVVTRALTWPVAPVCWGLGLASMRAGPDPVGQAVPPEDLSFVAAAVVTWAVGVMLTWHRPTPPAGWAFLGLGTVMAVSAMLDEYADLAVFRRPDAPAGRLAATLSDSAWVWWFVAIALVLVLTAPTPPRRRWLRHLPALTAATGLAYQVAALLRPSPLDTPYDHIASPLALRGPAGEIAAAVAVIAVIGVGICVLASATTLVLAWRHSEGQGRQRLLWLVAGSLPLVPCVLFSYAVSYAGHAELAGVVMAVAIISLVVGAALSVLRYRLYDVERVVTDSVGLAISAVAVIGVFLAVLVVISRTTPADASSQLPTVVATLTAAAVARSVYVWARRTAQKRVNRGRFEAVETVRGGLSRGPTDLDALLRDALGDPTAHILYPSADGAWVTTGGQASAPAPDCVDVCRGSTVTAKLQFDDARVDRSVVQAVAHSAAAEIDNVALRAELARQVELISESRARLSTAHQDERQRLERDLHDGAQQRLLAIALQLQSARVNGSEQVLIDQVDHAVAELGVTVQDLRDLAGGLQPAALAGGGLLAAVVDMVARVPIAIRYDVVDRRFPVGVENAGWFVISEAVTNIVKHASADQATVTVRSRSDCVHVVVADGGVGGADPAGHGLQGLADRVAALGGILTVTEREPHGTTVEAVLPCAS